MADFYIYAADIHCEECGDEIVTALRAERPDVAAMADAGEAMDSDDFPAGPYPASMGETDSPAHCGTCGEYLYHPLTSHGVAYAVEALSDFVRYGTGARDVLAEWAGDLRDYSLRGWAAVILGAALALLDGMPERAPGVTRAERVAACAARLAHFRATRERWQRWRERRNGRNAEALGGSIVG